MSRVGNERRLSMKRELEKLIDQLQMLATLPRWHCDSEHHNQKVQKIYDEIQKILEKVNV